MKILTGLFRFARKSLMTKDNDMGEFRQKLNELVEQKDTLSDDEVVSRVEEIKKMTNDLPDNDGKASLLRFLEDFKAVKEQDPAAAKQAAEAVAYQFEKLDTAAMQDVPGVGEAEPLTEGETPAAEETAEVAAEETVAPEGEPTDADVPVVENEEEEKPAEEKPAEDADPNSDYTLEEIYQFIKKRMAEDAEKPEEPAEEETVEEVAEESEDAACGEENDDVVTDHAPHIPVTVKDHAAKGSLAALFDMAKRGNN